MRIIASIKGVQELQAKLGHMADAIPKYISDAFNNTADEVVKNIAERTKVGATGDLKASWHPEYANPGKLTAKVGTHLAPHYGPDVEFGTRPHFPPIAALKEWAAKKLGDANAAYAVARAIAKRGTKAQKPFQQGTTNVKQILEKEIGHAADKIMSA
jgi:hypothetical protein